MEQHAVPRQVTTFEFKLIGFFTIKQFVYLVIFAGFALLLYFGIPSRPFNIVLAAFTMGIGAIFALYRYNERELDVWIKNLMRSLLAPSQYYYTKHNIAPDFLRGVFVSGDEQTTQTHIDANQKLSKYMAGKSPANTNKSDPKLQQVATLLQQPAGAAPIQAPSPQRLPPSSTTAPEPIATTPDSTHPIAFLSGVVHNNKSDPLPNIMVYINSDAGQVVRILKTNHHGLFATFHPLPQGSYTINPKDLGGKFFFDTMNITVEDGQLPPIEIYSKEVL